MKLSSYAILLFIFISCNKPNASHEISATEELTWQLPYFTYQNENLFPGDGSLLRAEDGVSLEDGRIIVVDQAKGLRLIEKDGSNRPFGNFAAAGFVHLPPEQIASPNGMVLEHDGEHVIFDGSTKDNLKITNEWVRRSHLGMERLELLSPDLYLPLPGLLTGMFFSNDGQTLYISNLGNDLLKYDF